MNYYGFTLRRGLVIISIWGLVTCSWAFFGDMEHWIPGLLLGYVAGALYYVLIQRQIMRGSSMPVEQVLSSIRGGLLTRMMLVTATVLLASRIPAIKILAVLVGAFSFPIVVFCNTITLIVKEVTGNWSAGR